MTRCTPTTLPAGAFALALALPAVAAQEHTGAHSAFDQGLRR